MLLFRSAGSIELARPAKTLSRPVLCGAYFFNTPHVTPRSLYRCAKRTSEQAQATAEGQRGLKFTRNRFSQAECEQLYAFLQRKDCIAPEQLAGRGDLDGALILWTIW